MDFGSLAAAPDAHGDPSTEPFGARDEAVGLATATGSVTNPGFGLGWGASVVLAGLIGLTYWAIATLSIGMATAYLTVMTLILVAPRPTRLNDAASAPVHPDAEPSTTGTADSRKPSSLAGPDRAETAMEKDEPDAAHALDRSTGPSMDAAGPAPTRPRRGRGKSRKTAAKAAVNPTASPAPTKATWVRVGPGKFVRAEVPDPAEPAPAAGPGLPVPEPGTTGETLPDVPSRSTEQGDGLEPVEARSVVDPQPGAPAASFEPGLLPLDQENASDELQDTEAGTESGPELGIHGIAPSGPSPTAEVSDAEANPNVPEADPLPTGEGPNPIPAMSRDDNEEVSLPNVVEEDFPFESKSAEIPPATVAVEDENQAQLPTHDAAECFSGCPDDDLPTVDVEQAPRPADDVAPAIAAEGISGCLDDVSAVNFRPIPPDLLPIARTRIRPTRSRLLRQGSRARSDRARRRGLAASASRPSSRRPMPRPTLRNRTAGRPPRSSASAGIDAGATARLRNASRSASGRRPRILRTDRSRSPPRRP
jgi:hypothetical protein